MGIYSFSRCIQYPSNYAIVSQINVIVKEGLSFNAGRIRNVPVTIGSSSYIPPLPFEDQVREDNKNIVESNQSPLDKAIEALLYIKSIVYNISVGGWL